MTSKPYGFKSILNLLVTFSAPKHRNRRTKGGVILGQIDFGGKMGVRDFVNSESTDVYVSKPD
jgi:hypothetical protein